MTPFKTAFTDPALDNYVAARRRAHATVVAELGKTGARACRRTHVGRHRRQALAASLAGRNDGRTQRCDAGGRTGAGHPVGPVSSRRAWRASRIAVGRSAGRDTAAGGSRGRRAPCGSTPSMTWRADRDRWSHELTDAAARRRWSTPLRAEGLRRGRRSRSAGPGGRGLRPRHLGHGAPPLPVDAEFPLFFIYTSGSTGKPKGVVHVHGGYVAGVTDTMAGGLRRPARRCPLCRRRSRLDHRPELYDLRRPGRRSHLGRDRRRAGVPALGPLRLDHRALRRDHLQGRGDLPEGDHAGSAEYPGCEDLRPVVAARGHLLRRARLTVRPGVRHGRDHEPVHQQLLGDRTRRDRLDPLPRRRRFPPPPRRPYLAATVDRRRRLGRGRRRDSATRQRRFRPRGR